MRFCTSCLRMSEHSPSRFTCFTGTKVPIVTGEEEEAFVAGFSSPKDFDELALPFIFVEPPSLSSRVVNQWGWYA
jgi:hypothetical protein